MTTLRQFRISSLGVEFPRCGDSIIWLWPWKRNGLPKYISIGFTGTGEWGDARFSTLREIDAAWDNFLRLS